MRASAFLLALAVPLWGSPVGASSIAKEPLLRVLRGASPAIRSCADRFVLPAGRYAVKLTIFDGRAREVTLERAAAPIGRAAESCLTRAFSGSRFPTLTSLEDGHPEQWSIVYPFVLELSEAAERIRPRPARRHIRGR